MDVMKFQLNSSLSWNSVQTNLLEFSSKICLLRSDVKPGQPILIKGVGVLMKIVNSTSGDFWISLLFGLFIWQKSTENVLKTKLPKQMKSQIDSNLTAESNEIKFKVLYKLNIQPGIIKLLRIWVCKNITNNLI